MKNKFSIFTGLALLVWMNRDLSFLRLSFGELSLGILALVLCFFPILGWVKAGMKEIPLFELFCAFHFFYYVSPCLLASPEYMEYAQDVRLQTCLVVIAFLLSAQFGYRAFSKRPGLGFLIHFQGIFKAQLPLVRHISVFWGLLLVWVLFETMRAYDSLPDFRGYLNMVGAIVLAAGTASTYYLCIQWGQGRLSSGRVVVLATLAGIGFLMTCSGGMLYGGAYIVTSALVSYTVGKRRVPWLAVLLFVIFLDFMHAGKADMRKEFVQQGQPGIAIGNPVKLYSYWFEASFNRIFKKRDETTASGTILERARLISMLELVISKTPEEKPFLEGETYKQTAVLFVPRFIMPNKPRGNLPSETLGIYYGVQTAESVETVSIAIGRIAEGWANFGWLGVIAAGGFSGWLLGVLARIPRGLPTNTVGYVLGLLCLFAAVAMEPALGSHLVALTQMLLVSTVLLYLLSRRAKPKRNAFAVIFQTELGKASR